MHPNGPCGFLGGMTQVPLLLGLLDATGLNETAIIIVIVIDGIGLEVALGRVACLLRGPLLIIGGQTGDPDHCGLQAFGPGHAALPMADGMHVTAAGEVCSRRRLARASAVTVMLVLAGTTQVISC